MSGLPCLDCFGPGCPSCAPPASTPAPACACDMRTRLVGDGCDVCNPPANTPAPAWEWDHTGTVADIKIGPWWLTVARNHATSYRASVTCYDSTPWSRGPYSTAPEAARAAVAALRAIVGPVVEALDRVPELEVMP